MSNVVLDRKSEVSERIFGKDLFFIVGVPRSGTTWVQRILDSHPNITCKGEAHFVDIFHTQLSKALKAFNESVVTQGGIVAHLRKFGGHVDTLSYDMNDSYYLLALVMGLMFRKWVMDDNIQLIGEKTPDNIMFITLLSKLFPSAKFIHIIRDGRDCAVSGWYFQKSNVDRNKKIVQSFEEYVRGFAKAWQTQVNQGNAVGSQLGARYREVFYESLLKDTRAETNSLLRYLGVDDSSQIVDGCVQPAAFEVLAKNRSPGNEDPGSFYRKGIAGDWKNHFDSTLTAEFEKIAGATLGRLGYE